MQNQRKRIKKLDKERIAWGIAFTLPLALFFIVFRYYTSFDSLVGSFFSYTGNKMESFVGFANYKAIFTNPSFWNQLKNTVLLYVYGLIFGFFIPIIQALLISNLPKGKGVFKYMYLIPAAIPSVAAYALWKYIWDIDYGLANAFTEAVGLGVFKWLQDPKLVKFCLRFSGILGGGINVLIYLVAIENLPQEMYEAARLDGTSDIKMMIKITLPNITYMISLQFLLSLTTALLSFDDVYVMTQGGPSQASETLVMGIYNQVYNYSQYGIGMATSIVVLIIAGTLAFIQNKLQSRRAE